MRTTARKCADAAVEALHRSPPILYSQEDCQGFVEQTVKRAGGTMRDYRGSNDMFRNAVSRLASLRSDEARELLVPGAVLFILKHDEKEPARYYADRLGNASHIGWYIGSPTVEVVHSSASVGRVNATSLNKGWTHVGWLKEVDYETQPAEHVQETPDDDVMHFYGVVHADNGKAVNVRSTPSDTARVIDQLRPGTRAEVVGELPGWRKLRYNGREGWMMERFFKPDMETAFSVMDLLPDTVTLTLSRATAEYLLEMLKGGLNVG